MSECAISFIVLLWKHIYEAIHKLSELHLCLFHVISLAPDPVSNITVEQNSSRHIYLSWTQPCHPNGIITNYIIDVKNYSYPSNAVQDIRFTNNSRTSFNVTNLHPYRSYQFIVKTQVQNVFNLSRPTTSDIYNTSTEGNQFVLI